MVIAHIGKLQRFTQGPQQLRMSVAEAVGAAVEMEIHELTAIHIAEAICLALADYQVDAKGGQHVDPVGKKIVAGTLQDQGLLRRHRLIALFSHEKSHSKTITTPGEANDSSPVTHQRTSAKARFQ